MPVTKSAKKSARQALTRMERNKAIRTKLKTFMKKIAVLSKTNPAEAQKALPLAYSVIDTAYKKNMIHRNNAARKKSLLARTVSAALSGKTPVVAPKAPKASKAKKAAKAPQKAAEATKVENA